MDIGIIFVLVINVLTLLPTHVRGQVRPPRITEHPSDILVRKFEPVTLNCKAEGRPPPVITWFHDGAEIREGGNPNRILLHSGSLFFLEVLHSKKDQDTGTYWCVASNEFGQARSKNATLEVALIRDDFRVIPKNVMTAMGDTATLECTPPKGYPEPTVKWKKEGETVTLNKNRVRMVAPGNLVISEVQQSDQGRYVCLAENMAGTRESLPVHLAVHVKPFFLKEPEHITVLSNVNVEFECRVGGDPLPTITWRRQDGKMPFGRANIAENKSLLIENVTPADDGTYVCEAKNPVGSVSSSVSLTVHSRPQFLVTPQNQKIGLNGVAKFDCSASGNPPPSIFWTKEGNQLLMFPEKSYGHFSVTREGTLLISGVKRDDKGYYICSVLSAIGSTMSKAYLEVVSSGDQTPPIIRLGPSNQTLPMNTVAMLPCEASGYPPPTMRWFVNSVPLDLENPRYVVLDSGTLQIDDLQPIDTGLYRCAAISESGETSWTASLSVESPRNPNAVFHRMPDSSAFPDTPGKPIILNVTETSMTLSWRRSSGLRLTSMIGYTVEYYSSDLQSGWVVAANRVPKEVFTIQNLRPDTQYEFLVRAENSHGLSYPSPVSDPIRTAGSSTGIAHFSLSEARIRLNSVIVFLQDVVATSSTAVKMIWKVQGEVNYVQGFYIRFRDVSAGSQKYNMVTVLNGLSSSYELTDLLKYTKYEFFLVPFYKSIEGPPSNTKSTHTLEDVPSAPPHNVRVDVVGPSSAAILWAPPPPQHRNGILQGYIIKVSDDESQLHSLLTTNASTTSVVLMNLTSGSVYRIKAAAFTSSGVGPYSPILRPKIDYAAVTLGKRPQTDINDVVAQPWFIALVASLIFTMLSVFFVILYFKRRMTWKKGLQAHLTAPVMKADDIRVGVSTRETLWINHGWHPTQSVKSSHPDGKLVVNLNTEGYLSGGTSDYAEVDTHSMTTFYKKDHPSVPAPYATTTLINPPIGLHGGSIHDAKSSSSEASKRSDKMYDKDTHFIEDSATEQLIDARNMISPSSDSGSYTTDEYGLPIRRKKLNPGSKNTVVNWADLLPPPPDHPPSAGSSPTATPSTMRNQFPWSARSQILAGSPPTMSHSPIINRSLYSNNSVRQAPVSPWSSLNRPNSDSHGRVPTPPAAMTGSRFPMSAKQKSLPQTFGSNPLIDRGVQSSLLSLASDPYSGLGPRKVNSEQYSNVNAANVPYYQLPHNGQSQSNGRYGFIVPSRVKEANSAESSAAEDTDYAQGHAPASWTSATDRSNASSVRSSIASSSEGSVYTDSDFVNAVTKAAHTAGLHLLSPSHPSNIDNMSPSVSLLNPLHHC